jgi:hypothetical protein
VVERGVEKSGGTSRGAGRRESTCGAGIRNRTVIPGVRTIAGSAT